MGNPTPAAAGPLEGFEKPTIASHPCLSLLPHCASEVACLATGGFASLEIRYTPQV